MKYVQNTSLQHMANIKIAATLCNQANVKNLLRKSYASSYSSNFKTIWRRIKAEVVENTAKLPLPEEIKKEILYVIRPVAFEISKWREFHYRCYTIRVDLPYEFYWMPQGTIDKKKTAEVMIKDQNIDIISRYKLACVYCLENDIKMLWEQIPEEYRKSSNDQEVPILKNQNELVKFWTYHIKGQMDMMDSLIEETMERPCSPYQYAFKIAAEGGNKVATEYFLQRLTPEEREESLVETAKCVPFGHLRTFNDSFMKEPFSHILFFLLRELNEVQQLEVFKHSPHTVLICFLDYPLQSFFTETANLMWNFLDKDTFGELLLHIIGKIKYGYKDFDYRKLFGTFWEQSPHEYKQYIFYASFGRDIMFDLILIRDENNIKLILQDATPEYKKYLIYDVHGKSICMNLIVNNQMSLLKCFIKACLPSKDKVIEFKYNFDNGFVWTTDGLLTDDLSEFSRVLHDVICEFKKRKCEEGDNTEAKKMCTENFHDAVLSAKK